MSRPFVVNLGGGTASGKTTLARMLVEATGALHLSHDRYYVDVPEPATFNYDHPDALDTDRLVEDLRALRAGQPAELPVYEFKTHRRRPETDRVAPRPMIVLEGILALHDPRLRALSDLSVYVETADDIRLARRILRDVSERGRSVESVIRQYMATVRPMHLQFVAPSRAHADMIVSGEGALQAGLDSLLQGIRVAGGPVPVLR